MFAMVKVVANTNGEHASSCELYSLACLQGTRPPA